MKFIMGGSKDANEVPEIPEGDEQSDSSSDTNTKEKDKCNSCPPSYEHSRGSRLSLARTNSSTSLQSAKGATNGNGGGANAKIFAPSPMNRSSSSYSLDKGTKARSMGTRSMSITSLGSLAEKPMSRAMSSASFYFESIKDEIDDESDFNVLYTRHERLPQKNFTSDIRALADVESFVKQATVFLDLDSTNMEEILETMLEKLLTSDEPYANIHDAKMDIFTHDSADLASDMSTNHLTKTMQGTHKTPTGGMNYDQQWLTILCTLPTLKNRHVGIARLKKSVNLGHTSQEVHFIILIVSPTKTKGTKNVMELGRTFSTLFGDMDIRYSLQNASTEEEFTGIIWDHAKQLESDQKHHKKRKMSTVQEEGKSNGHASGHDNHHGSEDHGEDHHKPRNLFCRGLSADLKQRLPYYIADYIDGVWGWRSVQKTLSTTFFLYFICLLPTIAFGALNDYETYGKIGVKEAIYGQTIAGLFFALIGGQPMTILLTTAPLAIYVKIIYSISSELGYEFLAMYAMVGVWNGFFCVVFALLDVSNIMNWARRSTEEVFACFVAVAYAVDAGKGIYKEFKYSYKSDYCKAADKALEKGYGYDKDGSDYGYGAKDNSSYYDNPTNATDYYGATTASYLNDTSYGNGSHSGDDGYDSYGMKQCLRENSLLHLMLAFGTFWMGLSIYRVTKTQYLSSDKRELLSSYALPVAAIFMSFLGSYVFKDVKLKPFNYSKESVFQYSTFDGIDIGAGFVAMGLGFCISLLFMVDQHECAGLVNIPDHRLKKGNAYHWDLLVVGILNVVLSGFGFPMVHGALPHSPLHVRAMADIEDRMDQGRITQVVVRARESRVAPILSHILIGLSLLLLPYPLQYIPKGVLDGIFLYLAVAGLDSSQMFERIQLLFTEQAAYPPNHYIRAVPQRLLHLFTLFQILQLGAMCAIGFSPLSYMKMTFPILIICLLPVRHNLIPHFISHKYLTAMDGEHH